MVKKWICILILLCFPCFLKGDELVVVLLNREKCGASRAVEQTFKQSILYQQATENGQRIKIYYGNDCPEYIKEHKVRWFPTVLKFEQDETGEWVEKERVIGEKNLNFLLDFLGKRRIILRRQQEQQPPVSGGS